MHPLRDAWVELLKPIPFLWFSTLTCDRMRRLHPEALDKKCRTCTRRLNEELYGRDWEDRTRGVGSVFAFEPHKDNRLHVHGLHYAHDLVDNVANRMLAKNLWEAGAYAHPRSMREGIARVLSATPDAAVAYCTKAYATKGGEITIDNALAAYLKEEPWQPTLKLDRS